MPRIANIAQSDNPNKEQLQPLWNLLHKEKYNDLILQSEELLNKFPKSDKLFNLVGTANAKLQKYNEAIKSFKKCTEITSNSAISFYNLASAFNANGNINQAISNYKKAIKLKPNYADAHNNLGVIQKNLGDFKEAVLSFQCALKSNPNDAEVKCNYASALASNGNIDRAIKTYEKIIKSNPCFSLAHKNLALLYISVNIIPSAIKSLEQVISLNPYDTEAYRNLSTIKNFTIGDSHLIQMLKLNSEPTLSNYARCNLTFALAKAYEDIGKLDLAYKFYSEGNALRKNFLNYNIDHDKKLFQSLKKIQSKLGKTQLKTCKKESICLPIFIVGMPRSGTTLIEQIISSHSQVTGAGELATLNQLCEPIYSQNNEICEAVLQKIRSNYLNSIKIKSNRRSYITDKMPHNFQNIPIIISALPEAKIVHVKRDAAATCWSNFQHYFSSDGLGYSYSLEDVVTYYKLYENLMLF